MKIITDSKKLEKEFLRLLEKYSTYYWSTAWASSKSKAFEKLKENIGKIGKIVVGIHFYQTHPEFIETFLDSKNVKYIKQPQGTFHPKIFLFYNNDFDWEILLGSANFTKAAFTINTEVTTLIGPNDLNADEVLSQTLTFINKTWNQSDYFDSQELENYKTIWRNLKPKRDSLSGNYGKNEKNKRKNKPIHLSSIIHMNWEAFVKNVKEEQYHSLNSRINVLDISKNLFQQKKSFSELKEDERKFIAGIPNKLEINKEADWAYFGSMKGAGYFKNRVKENDLNISNALDEIPLIGQITERHYQRFINHYKKTFSGIYLATATRLLAMKRPDVFICLDSKNKSALCKDFGIVQSGLDYVRYWDDIILRIYDSEWWKNPNPKNDEEGSISNARAAFLDSLYYEE